MPRVNLVKKETDMNMDNLFRKFVVHCRSKNLSQSTLEYYENSYYCFMNYHESGKLEEIDTSLFEGYLVYLRESTSNNDRSVKTRVSGIRTFLYYLMRNGYLEEFKITLPRSQEKHKETYTEAELKRLVKKPNLRGASYTELRSWAIVNFLLGTGCRASNIRNLRRVDLRFDEGYIVLTKTKNKKASLIPLSLDLSKSLDVYFSYVDISEDGYVFPSIYGGRLTHSALAKSIAKYNRGRNVNKVSIHAFRHTYAKYWILNRGDVFRLQKLLGHSSLDMVKNYVDIFDAELMEGYEEYNVLSSVTRRRKKLRI